MKIRARHCLTCAHLWATPIKIAYYTPNISGEATEYCPQCDSRDVVSGPAQETNNWDCEPGVLDRTGDSQ